MQQIPINSIYTKICSLHSNAIEPFDNSVLTCNRFGAKQSPSIRTNESKCVNKHHLNVSNVQIFQILVCMHVNGSISECGCWENCSFASLIVCFFAYGKRVHLILTCQYFTCYYFCMASHISKCWIFDSMLLSKGRISHVQNESYLPIKPLPQPHKWSMSADHVWLHSNTFLFSFVCSDYATKIQAQYKFSSYLSSVYIEK